MLGKFISKSITRGRTRATKDATEIGAQMVGRRFSAIQIYAPADEIAGIVEGQWFRRELLSRRMDDSKPLQVTISTELEAGHMRPAPTHGQQLVIEQLVEERRVQDRQWGGSDHDDDHERSEWIEMVKDHLDRAKKANKKTGDIDEYRQQMLEVAALCVAAVESHDRKREA